MIRMLRPISILILLSALLACKKEVIITAEISPDGDSMITIYDNQQKTLKIDSIYRFTYHSYNSSQEGSYYIISTGFDINIFAQRGDSVNLKIDLKTGKVIFSADKKTLNQTIFNTRLNLHNLKKQVSGKYNCNFKTFVTMVDSMLQPFATFYTAPTLYKQYETERINYFRGELFWSYAFNHALLSHTQYSLPEGFTQVLPGLPFTDSSLLNIPEFRTFLDTYLDLKAKLIAISNPKSYKDFIYTNCEIDIVLDEFKNIKNKNYALAKIMHNFLATYGGYQSESLLSRFNNLCNDNCILSEIHVLYSKAKENYRDHQIMVYKKTSCCELNAHVFLPKQKSAKPQPVLCCFFGGGWYEGSAEQFFEYCRFFAQQGFVAISFDYRIKGRNNTTPAEALQDVKSAIRWTRKNAKQFNIDPNKLSAIGWSAGDHLVAASAIITGFNEPLEDTTISAKPNIAILLAPCFEPIKDNWFYYVLENKYSARLLSPTENIHKSLPTFLCYLGTLDEYNPVPTAIEFEKRMKANHNKCQMNIVEGLHHNGFMNLQYGRKILHFIEKN